MARLQGAATTPKAEVSLRKVRLQGFAPNKGCRYPARRGLNPSHQTLLLGSSAEIGQRGAPQTPGDGVRTALSYYHLLHLGGHYGRFIEDGCRVIGHCMHDAGSRGDE